MKKFYSSVPEPVKRRTRENETKYNMGLADAFNEAVRHYITHHMMEADNFLYDAWYFSDYRNYIPQCYVDSALTEDQLRFKQMVTA